MWCFLCSQTTVNEGAEVSRGGLLCVIRGTRAAFPSPCLHLFPSFSLPSVPGAAINLLHQLLDVGLDFAWFSGRRSSPLISLQMISSALTVEKEDC